MDVKDGEYIPNYLDRHLYAYNPKTDFILVGNNKVAWKHVTSELIPLIIMNENGNIEVSYSYECNYENYSSIVGFNVDNPKSFKNNTEIFKDTDIDSIITQLESYYKAMTNTVAFTVAKSLYPYFDKIASKLGVDLTANTYSKKSSTGFFNNQTNGINPSSTIGDVVNNNQSSYDADELQKLIMR